MFEADNVATLWIPPFVKFRGATWCSELNPTGPEKEKYIFSELNKAQRERERERERERYNSHSHWCGPAGPTTRASASRNF